jgi:hypothetical protein
MNSMNTRLSAVLTLVLLAHGAATAQLPTAGSPTGINAAFVKLFGNVSAFSARLDTQVLDKSQKEWVRMPMDFAALDNKVRIDINLEQATSRDLPASTIAGLKQAGMERIVSIFRPDQKTTFILYPASKQYLTMSLAKGESEALEKGLQMEKTPLGKETIDGHACVKNKVVIKNQQGPVLEATTWNAGDLKELPIQIQTKEKDNTVIMRFKQIQFAKPDAKQFEVPAGYAQMK